MWMRIGLLLGVFSSFLVGCGGTKTDASGGNGKADAIDDDPAAKAVRDFTAKYPKAQAALASYSINSATASPNGAFLGLVVTVQETNKLVVVDGAEASAWEPMVEFVSQTGAYNWTNDSAHARVFDNASRVDDVEILIDVKEQRARSFDTSGNYEISPAWSHFAYTNPPSDRIEDGCSEEQPCGSKLFIDGIEVFGDNEPGAARVDQMKWQSEDVLTFCGSEKGAPASRYHATVNQGKVDLMRDAESCVLAN